MTYIALENIGDYKKGDIVPDEKAVVWMSMYDKSPVEKVEGKSTKKEEVETVATEEEKPVSKSTKKKGFFS